MNLFSGKEYVLGTFVKVADAALVEIAAHAGFDFVIMDCEHGPNSYETLQNHVRAAEAKGIVPVIRVPEINENAISKALDIGVKYVQIPQIETKADAERVVKASKFYPEGSRGVCRFVRAANYSATPKMDYFKNANSETGVIIHIEGKKALDNINEIIEVDGIDVIFIGPYDLSQSLGYPGEINHPRVIDMMEQIIIKASAKGKRIGTFAENIEEAKKWIKFGVQYISYSVDVGIYYEACSKIVESLK